MYSLEGVPPATLLILRPVNTLIGGAVAALVVLYVFPLREGLKFRKALGQFLMATDQYLAALTGSLKQAVQPEALGAATLQANDAFEAVAKTFPAVAMEYNPLSRAESPATAQATAVTALRSDVKDFAEVIANDTNPINQDQATAIQAAQTTIHDNIESLKRVLGGHPAPSFHTLAEQGSPVDALGSPSADAGGADAGGAHAQPNAGLRAMVHLSHINQTVIELGEEFRAVAQSPRAKNTSSQDARSVV
jgi:uncharacterized membrane protein YccC